MEYFGVQKQVPMRMGLEITEDKRDVNVFHKYEPIPTQWNTLSDEQKTALWQQALILKLPDKFGFPTDWSVLPFYADPTIAEYFESVGGKFEVMQWEKVQLTIDYGEIEWKIIHPEEPQTIAYHLKQLEVLKQCRADLRVSLLKVEKTYQDKSKKKLKAEFVKKYANLFFLKGPEVLVSPTKVDHNLYLFKCQQDVGISCQITFECTTANATLNSLIDGLTYALNRGSGKSADRKIFLKQDEKIIKVLNILADSVRLAPTFPKVNKHLLMAYIVGDICHKVVTLIPGASWERSISADRKNWRVLFPKSHPWQIMQQAIDTSQDLTALETAIRAAETDIITQALTLLAIGLSERSIQTFWQIFTNPNKNPAIDYLNDAVMIVNAGGDKSITSIVSFLKQYLDYWCQETYPLLQNAGGFLHVEFDNVVKALFDHTRTEQGVVRSTSFAEYTKGCFAFEDRAETEGKFSDTSEIEKRMKTLYDRYNS